MAVSPPREHPLWLKIPLNVSGPLGLGLALLGGIVNVALGLLFTVLGLVYVGWEIHPWIHRFVKRRPPLSLAVFLIGFLILGFVSWLIYLKLPAQTQTHTQSEAGSQHTEAQGNVAAQPSGQSTSAIGTVTQPKYPAIDFLLEPEKVKPMAVLSRPPSLILKIKNRGVAPLAEVKLRVTQYQFDYDAIVPATAKKLSNGHIQINPGKYQLAFNKRLPPRTGIEQTLARHIKENGGEKKTDLSKMQSFRFVKPPNPGERGGPGGPPLDGPAGESDELRFYALRFTFLDTGTNRRFAYYRTISCKEPYVLPFDNPAMGVTVDPEGRQAYFVAPVEKILADQKAIYKYYPEQEYMPAQAGMPMQP